VTVSPLLTSYEVTKIRKTIDEIRGRRVDTGVGQIKEIINIVSQFGRIENTEQLAEMLELRLYGKKQKQAKRGMLVLSDMLSLSRIKIKAPVRNKYDAIRQTGELLCMDGLATPEYTDAMLRLFEELGAYIVISPGVAMPHARADAGAKKTGFAIVTPREPVDFGHEKNDPVRIILALVATDNKSHLQAMKELSLLISQEDVFEELINSDTPDMMLTRILRFEEQMALKK
jgi:mannitol/fructose-specific phosphotransferase system IIA component (Ntr-type)